MDIYFAHTPGLLHTHAPCVSYRPRAAGKYQDSSIVTTMYIKSVSTSLSYVAANHIRISYDLRTRVSPLLYFLPALPLLLLLLVVLLHHRLEAIAPPPHRHCHYTSPYHYR